MGWQQCVAIDNQYMATSRRHPWYLCATPDMPHLEPGRS
jgi:hypothetical protein